MNAIDKGVFLDFGFTCYGTTLQVQIDELKIQAANGEEIDGRSVKVTKRLLESDEAKAIVKGDGLCRRQLQQLGFAYRPGFVFMPLGIVERSVAIIEAWEVARQGIVDRMADNLPAIMATDAERLGPMYLSTDYPTADKLRDAYGVRWSFKQLGEPTKLSEVSQSLLASQKRALQVEMTSQAEEWKNALRSAFVALVESLRERLAGDREGGKAKIFRDSRVESLKEWMSLFDARNISDDAELAVLVEKARSLLEGTSADELRNDAGLRTWTERGLREVKEAASTLVTADAPRRRFRLTDDEAA
jgi:hypothetical protein